MSLRPTRNKWHLMCAIGNLAATSIASRPNWPKNRGRMVRMYVLLVNLILRSIANQAFSGSSTSTRHYRLNKRKSVAALLIQLPWNRIREREHVLKVCACSDHVGDSIYLSFTLKIRIRGGSNVQFQTVSHSHGPAHSQRKITLHRQKVFRI